MEIRFHIETGQRGFPTVFTGYLKEMTHFQMLFIRVTSHDVAGVSLGRPHDCLFTTLFRTITKKSHELEDQPIKQHIITNLTYTWYSCLRYY